MIKALAIYLIATVMTFFQHNLQFINADYKTKQIYLLIVLSLPISFAYYYSWTYFVNAANGSVWSARFTFFGLSYITYPLLAYYFLGESPFTIKTISCVLLSLVIIGIQYKF